MRNARETLVEDSSATLTPSGASLGASHPPVKSMSWSFRRSSRAPSSALLCSPSAGAAASLPPSAPSPLCAESHSSSPYPAEVVLEERSETYTADAKGLRYLSLSAVIEASTRHLLRSLCPAGAGTAAEAERHPAVEADLSSTAGAKAREPAQDHVSDNGFFPYLQDCYRQLTAQSMRLQNPPHASTPETENPISGRPEARADLPRGRRSAETPSSMSPRCSPSRRREPSAQRAETYETVCGTARDQPQEVFAGVISVEKLAMLDAGVYVPPDLSEILNGRSKANEVQAMLNRCRQIDLRIRELKKRAYIRKLHDVQPPPGRLRGGESARSSGHDGPEVVGPISTGAKVRGGESVFAAADESPGCSMRSANTSHNIGGTVEHSSTTDAYYAVAASVEIVALRREKLQLCRRLADVRALVEYIWTHRGFSPSSCMDLKQFCHSFCSNQHDVSQRRAAVVLFELCDVHHQGSISLEDVFNRLPLRALEVMFIATERERKERQAYRYYWI